MEVDSQRLRPAGDPDARDAGAENLTLCGNPLTELRGLEHIDGRKIKTAKKEIVE